MSVTIKYNGSNVATVEGGNTATLPVKNKKMATDIIVTVPENKGEVLPDHTDSDFTLQLANTASGELGVVYSSTEKVAFDAAPNGKVIETFFDANFITSNIKKDVEIFGVTGEYGGGSADDRVKYVTYMDRGAELIKYPVIEGDTARDPVAKGYIEKPTKEPTASTVYTQSGWSKTDGGAPDSTALQNVTEDRTVYAAFTESVRKYTINFYDGDRLDHTEQIAYGGSSSYSITKEGYILIGWLPAPTNVTADMDCYAQWIEGVDFATAEWSKIAEISEAGKASEAFTLGQTRTETMTYSDGTTETIELEIVSFAEKDENGNAVMTLVPKNLINKKSNFSKSGGTTSYIDTSIIKPYLENTILPALPSDLQGVLKPTKIRQGISTYYYSKIALLDCDNICVYYEGTNYTDTVPTTLYGFDTTNAKRVRKTADGTAQSWWVNIVNNTSGKCLYVSPAGKGSTTGTTNSSYYILFKICV